MSDSAAIVVAKERRDQRVTGLGKMKRKLRTTSRSVGRSVSHTFQKGLSKLGNSSRQPQSRETAGLAAETTQADGPDTTPVDASSAIGMNELANDTARGIGHQASMEVDAETARD